MDIKICIACQNGEVDKKCKVCDRPWADVISAKKDKK